MGTVTPQIRTLPGPGIRGSHRLEQPQTCPLEPGSYGARRHPTLGDWARQASNPTVLRAGEEASGREAGPTPLLRPRPIPGAPQALDAEKREGFRPKPSPGVSAPGVGGVTRREGTLRLWAFGRVSGRRPPSSPRLGRARPGVPGPVRLAAGGAGGGHRAKVPAGPPPPAEPPPPARPARLVRPGRRGAPSARLRGPGGGGGR